MGNKNLILVVAVILLWFLMIRPVSKQNENEDGTESNLQEDSVKPTNESTTTPKFETGTTRTYTM